MPLSDTKTMTTPVTPRCLLVAVLMMAGTWLDQPAFAKQGPFEGRVTGQQALFGEIESAIAAGDASRLLTHAADQIDVLIFGVGSLYSRAQARYVIQRFFDDHPPRRFAFFEYPGSRDRSFAIGRYWEAGHDTAYQVYVYLRLEGNAWKLKEFRVERPGSKEEDDF